MCVFVLHAIPTGLPAIPVAYHFAEIAYSICHSQEIHTTMDQENVYIRLHAWTVVTETYEFV